MGTGTYAQNIQDATLDRSYEYDQAGRLAISHSGAEARAHAYSGQWGTLDGPYSQGYDYDVWGNVTHKYGWGGEVQGGGAGQSSDITYAYTGNRRNSFGYDAAGNVTNDTTQTYQYDATGQQTYASGLSSGWGSAPTYHDNPLQVGVTTVQSLHITELRTAINSLRSHLGASAYSWTTSATTNDYISANPIIEMRTALDQILGGPSGGYAAGLAQGQPIKAIHIQELRDRLTATSGSDIRWLVTDQLGTPRMIFDQSGSLANTSRHDYLPFGEDLTVGGRTTSQGYTGDSVREQFTGYEA